MPRASKHPNHPIRLLRKALGGNGNSYSQEAFSELVGVPVETIRSYEMGRLPVSEDAALKIATATGVDPAMLRLPAVAEGFFTKEQFDGYREKKPAAEAVARFSALSKDILDAVLYASLGESEAMATPAKYRAFCFGLNRFLFEQMTALGIEQRARTVLMDKTRRKTPPVVKTVGELREIFHPENPNYAAWEEHEKVQWKNADLADVEVTRRRELAPMCYYHAGVFVDFCEWIHHSYRVTVGDETFTVGDMDIRVTGITARPPEEIFTPEQMARVTVKRAQPTPPTSGQPSPPPAPPAESPKTPPRPKASPARGKPKK